MTPRHFLSSRSARLTAHQPARAAQGSLMRCAAGFLAATALALLTACGGGNDGSGGNSGGGGSVQIVATIDNSINGPITGQEVKLTPSVRFSGSVPAGATLTQVRWDFGDGSPVVSINNAASFSTPQYKAYAGTGSFIVTLGATASTGETASVTRTISVQGFALTGLLANANMVDNIGNYTRLGADGQPLTIQNAIWSDTGNNAAGTRWECIQDKQSGLIWEVKTKHDPSALRHYTATFTWYDANAVTNGGNAGTEVDGNAAQCIGVADLNKCNTQAYKTAVNALPAGAALCGFRDWRVPSLDELRSTVLTSASNPSIRATHFPDVNLALFKGATWSTLTDSFYTEAAWNISYEFGNAEFDDKSLGLSTRLVRASTGGANGLLQIAASLNASITSPITGQETKLTPSLAFAGNVPAGATLTQVRWDFGDGSPGVMISDAANFTVPQYKSYAAADSYLVTLRLTANTGQNWEITRTIVVESYAPTGLLANANTVANIGDYTRLGADGQSLAIQNAAWNDNGSNAAGTRWECIKDNQSGLIWEVKTKNDPSALRDYRSTFIWYDVSEGSSGVQIDGDRATCNGVADLAKCNTQSYTTAVKGLPTGQALCGFRDWRMPSLNELLSLVLTPSREIYINETHFPDIDFSLKQDSGLMWTATQIGSNPDQAGAINFKSGITGNAPKNYGLSIRSGSTNLNSWDK